MGFASLAGTQAKGPPARDLGYSRGANPNHPRNAVDGLAFYSLPPGWWGRLL
jgi:hypothetical protein